MIATACFLALAIRCQAPNATNADQAKQFAAKAVESYFEPSLSKMERADFLLTPALLMQEAIQSEIVTTYPAE